MKRLLLLATIAAMLLALAPAVGAGNGNGNFTASLKGRNEIPAVDSNAAGQFILKVRGGDSLSFKLIVANIDNVVAAHIHCASVGVNGPIGVTLFTGAAGGRVGGILSQGAIAAPDADNPCGWVDNGDVIDAILEGGAYVNVHSTDFGSGEIRGQVN